MSNGVDTVLNEIERLRQKGDVSMEDKKKLHQIYTQWSASPNKDKDKDRDRRVLDIITKPEHAIHKSTDNRPMDRDNISGFVLSKPQRMLKAFMSPFSQQRSLLIFHSTGQGKTCTAIQIAENFRGYYKKCFVLSSPVVLENFKVQLFDSQKIDMKNFQSNQCTGTLLTGNLYGRDKETIVQDANNKVKDYYVFKGPREIANDVEKIRKRVGSNDSAYEKQIQKHYSNSLIIIDEVHNIRSDLDASDVKKSLKYITDLVKYASNTRLILMTATPMFDNETEILWIMNLIYYHERQPIVQSKVIDESVQVRVADFAEKYVSYMRGENPYTFPWVIPHTADAQHSSQSFQETIENIIPIFPSILSSYQEQMFHHLLPNMDGYEKIKNVILDENEVLESDSSADDQNVIVNNRNAPHKNKLIQLMQLGNFGIMGDKKEVLVGRKALLHIVKYDDRRNCFIYRNDKKAFHPENLPTYSSKLSNIVRLIESSKGTSFVFTEYLWAGILPIALALEHMGYKKYGTNGNVHLLDAGESRQGVLHNKSYVILSGDATYSNRETDIISTINAENNKDGAVIKVILGTRKISEGVDFKNIRQVHIMEPWYNLNRIQQVIGRAVRNYSHDALEDAKRNTTVFYHCNKYSTVVPPKKQTKVNPPLLRETHNERVYKIAIHKQRKVSEIERLLKQHAFDCNLHLDANQIKTPITKTMITSLGNKTTVTLQDRSFSKECDFMECNFTCVPSMDKDKDVDISTLSTMALDKRLVSYDVELLQKYILHELKTEPFVTYDALKTKFSNKLSNLSILGYAIDDLIRRKVKMVNTQGVQGYVIYRDRMCLFQPLAVDDRKISLKDRQHKDYNIPNRINILEDETTKKTTWIIPFDKVRFQTNTEYENNFDPDNNQPIKKKTKPNIKKQEKQETTEEQEQEQETTEEQELEEPDDPEPQSKYVITHALNAYKKMFQDLAVLLGDYIDNKESKQVIMDMGWDSLSEVDKGITAVANFEEKNESIRNSMLRTFYLIAKHRDVVRIHNQDTQSFSFVKYDDTSKKVKQVSKAIENKYNNEWSDTINEEINLFKKHHNVSNAELRSKIYGYGVLDKNSDHKFKIIDIIDPKQGAKGVICLQGTKVFNSNKLQALIEHVHPEAFTIASRRIKKLQKKHMCLLYEYLLRMSDKRLYAPPAIVNTILN
jgi:superfamily II DNA or RNA helicase